MKPVLAARHTCNNIRIGWAIVSCALLLVLAGCASFPSKQESAYPASYAISVDRATRLAARAMQEMGFQVFNQNEAAGYVHGHKIEKDPMGFAQTFNLEANFVRDAGGGLRLTAVCTAGKEVALSTYPGEAVAQFIQVFDRNIHEEVSKPRAPVFPRVPAAPLKSKEYQL